MCKRRAFTLIELMIAITIFSMIFGIVAMIYVHATVRTAQAMASNKLMSEMRDLDQYLENSIQNANSCANVSRGLPLLSANALQLTMPSSGNVKDSWGVYYNYNPISASGPTLHWGTGMYRTFFFANSAGNYANSGNYLWMAEANTSGSPAGTNNITNWTYYAGNTSTYRWDLIDGFSWSIDAVHNSVTYTITGSDLVPLGTTTATTSAQSRQISLTRTVYWRHSTT